MTLHSAEGQPTLDYNNSVELSIEYTIVSIFLSLKILDPPLHAEDLIWQILHKHSLDASNVENITDQTAVIKGIAYCVLGEACNYVMKVRNNVHNF